MSRIFTIEEATALLPRLREILTAMQETKQRVDAIRDEINAITRTASDVPLSAVTNTGVTKTPVTA